MFLTEEMYCKTEAHSTTFEYLLYECIIPLFFSSEPGRMFNCMNLFIPLG